MLAVVQDHQRGAFAEPIEEGGLAPWSVQGRDEYVDHGGGCDGVLQPGAEHPLESPSRIQMADAVIIHFEARPLT